jgi:hypothetical protein
VVPTPAVAGSAAEFDGVFSVHVAEGGLGTARGRCNRRRGRSGGGRGGRAFRLRGRGSVS